MSPKNNRYYKRWLWIIIVIGLIGWVVYNRLSGMSDSRGRQPGQEAIPVKIALVEQGPIELKRDFSGSLEATAEFTVAPKVGGRIERLEVDLADPVTRGQVVAHMDNDEHVQAVAQAQADLAVAKANLAEARNAFEIASREFNRVEALRQRGVASDSQLDTAQIGQLEKKAQLEVAEAQIIKAEAALETARIRLSYTEVRANWIGSDEQGVVAERLIDEGNTVSANSPLLTIVELNPIIGVIFVTEKDYARLDVDQTVWLNTDAYPGETFSGRITRIAPVFHQATRQARVELSIGNPDHRLKPGMFIRATVVLDRVDEAVIVPEQALTRRNDRTGLFVVPNGGRSAVWQEVSTGIREGDRVEITSGPVSGRVVVLGQQLLDDGSPVIIANGRTDKNEEPR